MVHLCSLMCATEDGRLRAEKELIKKKNHQRVVAKVSHPPQIGFQSLIAVSSMPSAQMQMRPQMWNKKASCTFLVGINRYQKYENLETPLRIYTVLA